MVKFTADSDDGRRLIGLGIEEGNVARLKQKKPIVVRLDDPEAINLGLPIDIMIWYGATHAELVAEVKPYINAATIVHDTHG
jgi:hypothetical protein